MASSRLPRLRSIIGAPRRLTGAEAAALKARPWPRLPWWLWLAVATTSVAMVTAAFLLLAAKPPPLPLGVRRSPPAGALTHDVRHYQAPALEAANAAKVVRVHAECARLAGVTLAGEPSDVALLQRAADRTCALRSTPAVERARRALDRAGGVVAFAGFRVTGNESTTLLGRPPAVLVSIEYRNARPERIAVLLVHEGTHVAQGRLPSAADELDARRAEVDACRSAFPAGGVTPNRGCFDAEALLALGHDAAIAELRKAGYR